MNGFLTDCVLSTAMRGWLVLADAVDAGGQVADAGGGADGAPAQAVNPFVEFLTNPFNLMLLSAILFMLIVVRPQQKQLKNQQKALSELKKNDRVVTNSGIHGTVTQANANETVVTIRIDENSGAKMTINRDTIAKIISTDSKE